jgi:hypothetical protein
VDTYHQLISCSDGKRGNIHCIGVEDTITTAAKTTARTLKFMVDEGTEDAMNRYLDEECREGLLCAYRSCWALLYFADVLFHLADVV